MVLSVSGVRVGQPKAGVSLSGQGQEIIVLWKAFRPAVGPIQLTFQSVPSTVPSGISGAVAVGLVRPTLRKSATIACFHRKTCLNSLHKNNCTLHCASVTAPHCCFVKAGVIPNLSHAIFRTYNAILIRVRIPDFVRDKDIFLQTGLNLISKNQRHSIFNVITFLSSSFIVIQPLYFK